MPIYTMTEQLFNQHAQRLTLTTHNNNHPIIDHRDNSTYNYIVVVASQRQNRLSFSLEKQTTTPKNIISNARKIGITALYTFHGIAMFDS